MSEQPTVRRIKTWVVLTDGTRLAVGLWLPDGAEPVPAVLEYLPYRQGDTTAARDAVTHGHLARHGFAGVRVDIRGTGDSEGMFDDEYSEQEHADAVEVIAWIAEQPWCSGSVGMMGISWGGFNSLQVAALRPPALRAIVTVCSTDDRYTDDCHYQGGAVIGDDMLPWGTTLLSIVAAPALDWLDLDDATYDERWRQRIAALEPPAHRWLSHPTKDAYWRRGSVGEDPAAIEVPVLVVGGWADGYSNAALRMASSLTSPTRTVIGPWGHQYPHDGMPGPTYDFLGECVRWWERWLTPRRGGAAIGAKVADVDRSLQVWRTCWDRPSAFPRRRSGSWTTPDTPAGETVATMFLADRRLADRPGPPGEPVMVRSRQDTGLETGSWCSYGRPGESPPDQRLTDGAWVVFDTGPLEKDLDVFGFPALDALLVTDSPTGNLCVRLCEVGEDGASLLVSEGTLNLTHRDGHDVARPMDPGVPTNVTVTMDAICHRFSRGHRLRLAVANASFPRMWPAPDPATLLLDESAVALRLPLLGAHGELSSPPEPQTALPAATISEERPAVHFREVRRSFGVCETAEVRLVADGGRQRFDEPGSASTLLESTSSDEFTVDPDDPLSARVDCHRTFTTGIASDPATVRLHSWLTATADHFEVVTELTALRGEREVDRRRWRARPPRAVPTPASSD